MGWGKSKFFGGANSILGGAKFCPPPSQNPDYAPGCIYNGFPREKKINCKLYPCINMCSVYLIMICVQLYQCIYVFSEAYTYQKMDCKLCLYDNMCIHILHMYLWLCCSILVYHEYIMICKH